MHFVPILDSMVNFSSRFGPSGCFDHPWDLDYTVKLVPGTIQCQPTHGQKAPRDPLESIPIAL